MELSDISAALENRSFDYYKPYRLPMNVSYYGTHFDFETVYQKGGEVAYVEVWAGSRKIVKEKLLGVLWMSMLESSDFQTMVCNSYSPVGLSRFYKGLSHPASEEEAAKFLHQGHLETLGELRKELHEAKQEIGMLKERLLRIHQLFTGIVVP